MMILIEYDTVYRYSIFESGNAYQNLDERVMDLNETVG